MEFAENGAVVTNDDVNEDKSYSPKPTSHGYEEGPRSSLGLYRAMRWGLIVYIGAELAWQIVLFAYMVIPQYLPVFMFQETENDLNYVIVAGLVYLAITIAAFFLACRFTYRTMRTLHTVKSPAAEISPFWSVGFYFVPFANLVMPANAMSQIYHGTHEAVGEKSRHASPIPIWWTCWLLSRIIESIADQTGWIGAGGFALYAVSGGLGIVAAVSLIRMGRRIADRQELLKHGGVAAVFD